jgi:hypothetical protein
VSISGVNRKLDRVVVVKVCLRRTTDSGLLAAIEAEPRGRRSTLVRDLLRSGLAYEQLAEEARRAALPPPPKKSPEPGESTIPAPTAAKGTADAGPRKRKPTLLMSMEYEQ